MRIPRTLIALAIALASLIGGSGFSGAADPAEGTLSASEPEIAWSGTHPTTFVAPNVAFCDVPDVCDEFLLTIEPIAGQDVVITLAVGGVPNDWDLFVYDENGVEFGRSGKDPGLDEQVRLADLEAGVYRVVALPFVVTPTAVYEATATFDPAS